jgi:hypothetical protein
VKESEKMARQPKSQAITGIAKNLNSSNSQPQLRKSALSAWLGVLLLAAATSLATQQTTPPSGDKSQQPAGATGDKAASQEQVNEANIQLLRENIRDERKKIVAANLPLTAEEATKFWPLYDRYIADTVKINDQRYAVIKEYAKSYSNMTDAQANSFIKRWVALDTDDNQLRLKYMPQFEKVISPRKTAMFFQIDHRLDTMIDLQLASQLPLIKP